MDTEGMDAEHRSIGTMTSRHGATGFRALWSPRRAAVALIATIALAFAVGVPTGIIPTPLYTRMTPIQWWNYPGWAATSILGGLVTATYIRRPGDASPRSGAAAATGGGLFGAFAVGCPVCNKLVVAALGASGAMTIWAPLQPALAVLTVVGLLWVLRRRLTNEYACPVTGSPREVGSESSDEHSSSLSVVALQPQRSNAATD